MLGVVKRHDLLRDVGLESVVLVRQGWQSERHVDSGVGVVDRREKLGTQGGTTGWFISGFPYLITHDFKHFVI